MALQIRHFECNPFQENTYVVWCSGTLQAALVDPGCHTRAEQSALAAFIAAEKLELTHVLNTHCHLDHIFGNAWAHRTYGLMPLLAEAELVVLHAAPVFANAYGIPLEPSPEPARFVSPGEEIVLGDEALQVVSAPGHSPGHLVFVHAGSRQVLAGDVLFRGSVGRTDLPGGNHATLMASIFNNLLPLGDAFTILPGHGPATTLGHERRTNPFLLEWARRG